MPYGRTLDDLRAALDAAGVIFVDENGEGPSVPASEKEMTLFYHYTSADALFGIGLHGLTVGDVPTDFRKGRGLIGVWLTSSDASKGRAARR